MFEESFKGVSRMFQESIKGVIKGRFRGNPKDLQEYPKQVKGVSRQFQRRFKEVSRCVKVVPGVF